jgi:hypothetical protein
MANFIQVAKLILHALISLDHVDKIMQSVDIIPDLFLFVLHLRDVETP